MVTNIGINLSGTGFFTTLFFIFLILKLTNVINWSWIWVTSPLWIPIVVVLTTIILIIIGNVING